MISVHVCTLISQKNKIWNKIYRSVFVFKYWLQQMETSRLISEKTKTLQQFKEDGDRLLYNMIPPSVARRLRTCGGDTLKTCEVPPDVHSTRTGKSLLLQAASSGDVRFCAGVLERDGDVRVFDRVCRAAQLAGTYALRPAGQRDDRPL